MFGPVLPERANRGVLRSTLLLSCHLPNSSFSFPALCRVSPPCLYHSQAFFSFSFPPSARLRVEQDLFFARDCFQRDDNHCNKCHTLPLSLLATDPVKLTATNAIQMLHQAGMQCRVQLTPPCLFSAHPSLPATRAASQPPPRKLCLKPALGVSGVISPDTPAPDGSGSPISFFRYGSSHSRRGM